MRLAWLSDIHWDATRPPEAHACIEALVKTAPDAVLVSGDIAMAPTLIRVLMTLQEAVSVPLYFVLGNHDFYGASIDTVRTEVVSLSESEALVWLGSRDLIALDAETALIGHDGWGDGRAGDYSSSSVLLNDFYLIRDFVNLDRQDRFALMQKLADESTEHIAAGLSQCAKMKTVVVLTHVPPFPETTLYNGKMSGPDFLPFFCNQRLGEILLAHAEKNPSQQIRVLCGHTHASTTRRPVGNLLVEVAAAEYGQPIVNGLLDL